jgi:hypothetical protein
MSILRFTWPSNAYRHKTTVLVISAALAHFILERNVYIYIYIFIAYIKQLIRTFYRS